LQRERELVARADLVVVTAETLGEKVRLLRGGRPMVTIRNGVDLDFWSAPCPEPAEYARIPSPRVVYAGAIEKWFDMELLLHLARALPRCAFVMIGQPRLDLPASPPPNIHWLGVRGRAATRALVRHAQVGIIPFRRNELIDCVCPVKLYEYMACGLPVVATRWSELERMRSPARLAATAEEWTEFLGALTAAPGATGAEMDYARANSWEARWGDWLAAPGRPVDV
jgi:glycosyltransferase involved in cell wall biosynthesis